MNYLGPIRTLKDALKNLEDAAKAGEKFTQFASPETVKLIKERQEKEMEAFRKAIRLLNDRHKI